TDAYFNVCLFILTNCVEIRTERIFSESELKLSILAHPCINGSYLPKQETELVHTVLEELEVFLQRNERKSVLLFPPLPSRFRFLIHETTLNHPDLSTFSVGEGCARRVVVCYSDFRLSEQDQQDPKGSSYYRARSQDRVMDDKCNTSNSRQRNKRPDKAIYVPRGIRHKVDLEQPNLKQSSEESCPNTAFVANPRPKEDPTHQPLADHEFVQLSKCGPSPWPSEWDETVSLLMSLKLDNQEDVNGANNTVLPTDVKLQEEGIDESLISEIKARVKDRDVTIVNTCSDFPAYANIWLDPEEFGHVIEIYDFPIIFKTEDILDAFADYSEGGMKIKWVDNTHALGIFSNQLAATEALSIEHPLLKTRALLEGSEKSKWKAARRAEFMQPVKERPRTDAVVARRMVSRALGLGGLRANTDK
ncbi:R3H and coiled-coil domain-containing protein 1, partial [Danio aesculapii]|uniref:R3H and coiled-coil domain-containing protein 1 n=1 Tax=Danio aesculapii TaxID=1142201 RepID=UPI0024BF3194